jgi:hypothetical protein
MLGYASRFVFTYFIYTCVVFFNVFRCFINGVVLFFFNSEFFIGLLLLMCFDVLLMQLCCAFSVVNFSGLFVC